MFAQLVMAAKTSRNLSDRGGVKADLAYILAKYGQGIVQW